MSASVQVLIVAAEESSCAYAVSLLKFWKKHNISVNAFGIGNQAMSALGFEVIGRAEDLAVVGIQEVFSHWSVIKKAFYDLVKLAQSRRPQVVLLLDYPDFNLRLAKKLKALGLPVVYYISPQIWAWRKSRIHQIRKRIDKMLVVFPFEEPFYQNHGVPVQFVGHPLLEKLDEAAMPEEELIRRRQQYGLGREDVLLALMPGSRRSEIRHHLQTQLQVAERLTEQHPYLKVALFVAPGLKMEELKSQLGPLQFPLILIQEDPLKMIPLADVVLTASGTATLLVGLLGRPLVIMYKMNGLSATLAKMFVKSVPYFGMINLVLGREVAPEFFQEKANVENLSQSLSRLIGDPGARSKMSEELTQARQRLGRSGATERVAQALSEYLGGSH